MLHCAALRFAVPPRYAAASRTILPFPLRYGGLKEVGEEDVGGAMCCINNYPVSYALVARRMLRSQSVAWTNGGAMVPGDSILKATKCG